MNNFKYILIILYLFSSFANGYVKNHVFNIEEPLNLYDDHDNNSVSNTNLILNNDPYENINRKIYQFNKKTDKIFFIPLTKIYLTIFNDIKSRSMLNNVLNNASEPLYAINSLLQGNFKNFLASSARFIMNSSLGILGIYDIASKQGIQGIKLTIANTLKFYNFSPGPYLIIPLLGPSNFRGFVGLLGNILTNPLDLTLYFNHGKVIVYSNLGITIVDMKANFFEATTNLHALDEYTMLKSIFMQMDEI